MLKGCKVYISLCVEMWLTDELGAVSDWLTLLPVLLFVRVTVPAVGLAEWTVIVIVLPAEIAKLEKS